MSSRKRDDEKLKVAFSQEGSHTQKLLNAVRVCPTEKCQQIRLLETKEV